MKNARHHVQLDWTDELLASLLSWWWDAVLFALDCYDYELVKRLKNPKQEQQR